LLRGKYFNFFFIFNILRLKELVRVGLTRRWFDTAYLEQYKTNVSDVQSCFDGTKSKGNNFEASDISMKALSTLLKIVVYAWIISFGLLALELVFFFRHEINRYINSLKCFSHHSNSLRVGGSRTSLSE